MEHFNHMELLPKTDMHLNCIIQSLMVKKIMQEKTEPFILKDK